MNQRPAVISSCLLAAVVFACASDDGTQDGNDIGAAIMDASSFPDVGFGSDGEVIDAGPNFDVAEIGTGVDFFEPLMEGDEVPIILGPQGGGRVEGYHLFHAARTRLLDPVDMEMTFKTFLASTGEEIAVQVRTNTLQPDGTGAYQIYSIAPRLKDCCAVENGTEVIMFVELRDRNGLMGVDQRKVKTSGVCEDGVSGASICP